MDNSSSILADQNPLEQEYDPFFILLAENLIDLEVDVVFPAQRESDYEEISRITGLCLSTVKSAIKGRTHGAKSKYARTVQRLLKAFREASREYFYQKGK